MSVPIVHVHYLMDFPLLPHLVCLVAHGRLDWTRTHPTTNRMHAGAQRASVASYIRHTLISYLSMNSSFIHPSTPSRSRAFAVLLFASHPITYHSMRAPQCIRHPCLSLLSFASALFPSKFLPHLAYSHLPSPVSGLQSHISYS